MGSFWHRNAKRRSSGLLERQVRRARPSVEQLENRLTPSTVTPVLSSNWSGYAAIDAPNQFSAVGGSWVVPTVTATTTSYSSVWVGLDGYSSNTVEQIGTEQDVTVGRRGAVTTSYYAWYEMYPAGMVEITSLKIKPGDSISASVDYKSTTGRNSSFALTIADTTEKETYTVTKSIPTPARSSAEWIVEAPSSYSGVLPLDNFGSVNVSGGWATAGTTVGAIDNAAWTTVPINMTNPSGSAQIDNITVPVADPATATLGFQEPAGTPNTNTSASFTVTYTGPTTTTTTTGGGGSGSSTGSGGGFGRGHHFWAVNVPATAAASNEAAFVTSQAKITTSGPAAQPTVSSVVNPANGIIAASASSASPTLVPASQPVLFRAGDESSQSVQDQDSDASPAMPMQQEEQAPPAAAPAILDTPDAPSRSDADQTLDAVFLSASDAAESGILADGGEAATTPAQAAAVAALLLALGMQQNETPPESQPRRKALS